MLPGVALKNGELRRGTVTRQSPGVVDCGNQEIGCQRDSKVTDAIDRPNALEFKDKSA